MDERIGRVNGTNGPVQHVEIAVDTLAAKNVDVLRRIGAMVEAWKVLESFERGAGEEEGRKRPGGDGARGREG